MDIKNTTLYSWRRSIANVATYLELKGVIVEESRDFTVSLRNHNKEVSNNFYTSWTHISDAIREWCQLRKAEEIYIDKDKNFFKIQPIGDGSQEKEMETEDEQETEMAVEPQQN